MTNVEKLIGLGIAAVLGYSFYVSNKWDRVAAKLDSAADEVMKKSEVEVSDEIINNAVKKAVKKEVSAKVKEACENAVDKVSDDIRSEVKAAVTSSYNDIRSDVVKEVERQVGEINIESVRNEVIAKAKDQAARKFDNDLASVLTKYDDQLSNVTKIYSSIANVIRMDNNRDMTFRFN